MIARQAPSRSKTGGGKGGEQPDPAMKTALISCLRDFQSYLGAERVRRGPDAEGVSDLDWLEALEG